MYSVMVMGPQERELRFKVRSKRGPVNETSSDEAVLHEAFVENTYGLHPDHFAPHRYHDRYWCEHRSHHGVGVWARSQTSRGL